jgi:uncharacterized RDD family membrane protein YckC
MDQIKDMDKNKDIFASLSTRIKASILDCIILMALFISIPMVIGNLLDTDSPIKVFAMFAPVLLLEPILVAFSGATIGQHFFGMEVIRVNTRSKCPFHVAFLRYLAKAVLGSISLVYMLFSKKHQAIHDHLAKTVVLISQKKLEKNPEMAKYGETEQTLIADYSYPSAIRRFILFIVWYIVSVVAIGIFFEVGAILIFPDYTIESEKLPEFYENILSIVFAVVFITLAFFASKGFLPGARRKKNKI